MATSAQGDGASCRDGKSNPIKIVINEAAHVLPSEIELNQGRHVRRMAAKEMLKSTGRRTEYTIIGRGQRYSE